MRMMSGAAPSGDGIPALRALYSAAVDDRLFSGARGVRLVRQRLRSLVLERA